MLQRSSKSIRDRRASYVARVLEQYAAQFRESHVAFRGSCEVFPNGAVQAGRRSEPFPLLVRSAEGSRLKIVGHHELIDLWAGHFAMVLGNNPPAFLDVLRQGMVDGQCLQTGVLTELEGEVARLILRFTGGEQVVFTTSGAQATMHAIMLAVAKTGRRRVLKMEGGWHGVQPWSVRAVQSAGLDVAGFHDAWTADVAAIPFNDVVSARRFFDQYGSQTAACILELVIGNCGMVPADRKFVTAIRSLCNEYGVVLILDEIVTGFRVCSGGLQRLYDVEPELSVYGKALSGGMPFACVVGSKEMFDVVAVRRRPRVWADVGTFTAHPATLLAVRAFLHYLENEGEMLFASIRKNACWLRSEVRNILTTKGICSDVTGHRDGSPITGFPISTIRFIVDAGEYAHRRGELAHWDEGVTDVYFRNHVSKAALALKGVFSWQGLGVVTGAHTQGDLDRVVQAYEAFAGEIAGLFPGDV